MPYRSKICCVCTCCRIEPTLHALREKLCQSNSSSVSTITSRNGRVSFGYLTGSTGTISRPLRLYGADAIVVKPSAGAIKGVLARSFIFDSKCISTTGYAPAASSDAALGEIEPGPTGPG